MTETRLQELQTEIARLQEIDNQHTERVDAEFKEQVEVIMGSFDENGDAVEFSQSPEALLARHNTKLSSEFSKYDELQIPCSKDLDMEWANESI